MPDVFANNRSILHAGDGLTQTAGPPDVCKTPTPGGPVPIPYPNIAMDSDLAKGTKKVKINGNPVATEASNLSTSTGDEAGTAGGGIISNKTKGKLTWGSVSGDVIAEGNGVARFMDVNQFNGNVWNTVITAMGSVTTPGYGDDPIDQPDCSICQQPKSKHQVEADKQVLQLAQELAKKLKDPSGSFAKAFTKGNGNPLKKGVMIGVLGCRCKTNGYAGLAGEWETDQFARVGAAFESEASSLGLIPVIAIPPQPPLSGQFPPAAPPPCPFGSIPSAAWQNAEKRVEDAQARVGRGNKPLTCAAPKMTQRCLEEGHKPDKMIEIWVAMRSDSVVEIPSFLHVTLDKTKTPPTTHTEWIKKQQFGDGQPVPSCTTCQVVQTIMLCNVGQPPCP